MTRIPSRPSGGDGGVRLISEFDLLLAMASHDLAPFTALAFSAVAPGAKYLPNWHIRAITHALDRVERGECKRLIITMPPRSLKSVTASVAFPAWLLARSN
jgi:hypothetical protein